MNAPLSDPTPSGAVRPFHPDQRDGVVSLSQRVRSANGKKLNELMITLRAGPAPAVPETQAAEQDVTALFCDIADYSTLAEQAGPRTSYRLVTEVMEHVTARVDEYAGSVVDYYGDGILVMWNAPSAQADHAARACQAALSIQADVPELAANWNALASTPLRLRCTLNSGPVLVGNTGTRHHIKYGPMGHTVNLARRVQSAGKFFGLPTVITAATRSRLVNAGLAFRRLGRAHLAGMAEATELFELHAPEPGRSVRAEAFEKALMLFEAHRWHDACRALHSLLEVPAEELDLATLHLLGRAIDCLKAAPTHFDAVWELTGT